MVCVIACVWISRLKLVGVARGMSSDDHKGGGGWTTLRRCETGRKRDDGLFFPFTFFPVVRRVRARWRDGSVMWFADLKLLASEGSCRMLVCDGGILLYRSDLFPGMLSPEPSNGVVARWMSSGGGGDEGGSGGPSLVTLLSGRKFGGGMLFGGGGDFGGGGSDKTGGLDLSAELSNMLAAADEGTRDHPLELADIIESMG